jgi:hypothetical protein
MASVVGLISLAWLPGQAWQDVDGFLAGVILILSAGISALMNIAFSLMSDLRELNERIMKLETQ